MLISATIDQWLALIIGFIAVICALRVGFLFFRLRDRLSRLLAWNLIAEAYLSVCTLVFAVGAFAGCLQYWPSLLQSLIRISMFLFAITTTFRLYLYSSRG